MEKKKSLAWVQPAFRSAITSRMFWFVGLLGFLEMVIAVIFALTHIHVGLAVKTHCEITGNAMTAINCTSEDAPWFYVFNFAVLPIVIFAANSLVGLKLLSIKGRTLALCWLWLSLLVGLAVTVLSSVMVTHVVG